VQVVKWNPQNESTLLTAGFDRRINVADARDQASSVRTKLPKNVQDIESASWHPQIEHNFAVSTESGIVLGYDSRNLKEPVFNMQAHESACSSV
jgi:WD40 repeat protein